MLGWNAFVGRSSRILLALWCHVLDRIRSLLCQAGALGVEDHGVEEREPLTFPLLPAGTGWCASAGGSPCTGVSSANGLSHDWKFAPAAAQQPCLQPTYI